MLKNFNVPLLDARGEEVKENGKPLLVADIAIAAVTEPAPGDHELTSKEKINLHSLALRIGESTRPDHPTGGSREFSKDELVTIKTRASKNVRILSFGRLCEVIDSDEVSTSKSDVIPLPSGLPQ